MSEEEFFVPNQDNIVIRNTKMDTVPDPCSDCGREYLVRESVSVHVEGKEHPVWKGCLECWVKRTSPEVCTTFDVLTLDKEIERQAEIMHYAYEEAALRSGWQTNPRSRVLWSVVPEENKVAMRASVRTMLEDMKDRGVYKGI